MQGAPEIVGENVWFSTNFNNFVNNLNSLPYDHHLLAGLVAPRGLVSFENTDFAWLAPMSSWGCANAVHSIYTALGVPDNHGFVQQGGHAHCAWPATQNNQLNAFINKFLLGQSTSTSNILQTNNVWPAGETYNQATWINWQTPTLT